MRNKHYIAHMGDRFLNVLKILRGGVEVVGIIWHCQKRLQWISPFRLSGFRVSFFANRGLGLRHAFFVSVIFPVTCDGLDHLIVAGRVRWVEGGGPTGLGPGGLEH